MGLEFRTLWDYSGMFKNCYLEPCRHGWSIFDKKNQFVGMIYGYGFGINSEYEYHDEVHRELVRKGITVFDYDTHEEIKDEQEIEELLYK